MDLIKTSILSSISTAIRIVSGFLVNKVMAVHVGPSGLAFFGQFINFTSIMTLITSGGIKIGIVKYVAEYHNDHIRRKQILSTGVVITLAISLVAAIPTILMSQKISLYLLKTEKYSSLILIFGAGLILFSMSNFLLSVLNGQKEIGKYIGANIYASLVGLILSVILVVYLGIYGVLLSVVLSQAVVFFIVLFSVVKSRWFKLQDFLQGWDKASFKKLGKFSLMVAISATLVPVSLIIIRNYIIEKISLNAAGYWEGVWRISEGYLTVVTTSLSVYYLPRLSEITDNVDLRREIFFGYKIIMPIAIVLASTIFLFKEIIIKILFTESFMPMIELFTFQLLGDILKIASWLLSILLHAKAMAKIYILTDMAFALTFVLFSMAFIENFGLVGVTYAYALNYLMYFLTMIYLFRKIIIFRPTEDPHAIR